jgi:hypothetical protein
MFLGSYTFGGDIDELVAGYERLLEAFPPDGLDLHVCITRPDGLQVLDACPSREVWRSFATSPEFHAAVKAAGLPEPVTVEIGEVHAAFMKQAVHQ